jgi:cobalt/nickel transport protein
VKRRGWFFGAGLLLALVLAGVVSNFASDSPDGLDAVTRQGCSFDSNGAITDGACAAQQAQGQHDAPLPDYGVRSLGDTYLSNGVAGVAGVLVTFGVGAGIFWLVRRRGGDRADAGTP